MEMRVWVWERVRVLKKHLCYHYVRISRESM